MPDAKPPKKKLGAKQIVILAMVVLALVAILKARHPSQDQASSPQDIAAQEDKAKGKLKRRIELQMKETKGEGASVSCTAAQLYRDYKANEVAADSKYKGKWVEVKGQVLSVAKDITDKPYLSLAADGYGVAQVHAALFDVQPKDVKGPDNFTACPVAEKAAKIQTGQQVTVACMGKGSMMTIPALEQCIIVDGASK